MKYRVVHDLRRDGKEYGPGESITLSDDEAKQCGSALQPWSAHEVSDKDERKQLADEAEKKKADEEAEKKKADHASHGRLH